ncbi:MAG: zinc finger UBP-type protein [Candidatus Solibacter sp.]|jgi:CPA2 family monovalent cation:H+ antiporter-2|nr:zinc finger UBP-type protein [Candidatus Solibacter sp.]
MAPYPHFNQSRNVRPGSRDCDECPKAGDSCWHLHLCFQCGHFGCGGLSPNKHATRHDHGRQRYPAELMLEFLPLYG